MIQDREILVKQGEGEVLGQHPEYVRGTGI